MLEAPAAQALSPAGSEGVEALWETRERAEMVMLDELPPGVIDSEDGEELVEDLRHAIARLPDRALEVGVSPPPWLGCGGSPLLAGAFWELWRVTATGQSGSEVAKVLEQLWALATGRSGP